MNTWSVNTQAGYTFRFVLFLLLALCGKNGFSQEPVLKTAYSYRLYTIHDGLPEMICYSLYQDSKGFMWIGTINGFARYDGYTFHPYLAVSDEAISGFNEDAQGTISGIAVKRLHRLDAERDTVFSGPIVPKVADKYADVISKSMPVGYAIYQIDNSRAVYSFTDSGLVKIWEHETLNKMHDGQKPCWDKNNKRFFVPTVEGVYIIGENGVVTDSFAINTMNCFIPYKGGFRAVADDGIYEYDNHSLTCILKYPFHTGNMKDYSLLEDANGNQIIRAENAIFRYANGQLETITDQIAQTNDMCFDREGNLWVATAGGVYNFFGLNFKNHILSSKENIIRSVIIDKNNQTWMASLQGDLVRLQNEKVEKIAYPASPHPFVFFDENAITSGDDLYLSGSGGVLHYNLKSRKFNWLNLPADLYLHMLPLPDGDLAIGNYEVTSIYRPGKGIIRQFSISETKQMSICAVVDKQRRLLLGGTAGVVIINGDSIQHLTDERLRICRKMVYDNSGTLWLSFKNNLVSMKNDQFTIEHTFPNTLIRSIYFTRTNILIVATVDAIYLSKNGGNHLDFVRYDLYNGFNFLGVLTTSMAEDATGHVWLLTSDGAVLFHPEKLLRKQPTPLLYVQTMQSSTDNIVWANMTHSKLNYNSNNVKFRNVALCFSSTGNVRYHYRLLGFQNEWSEPTKQRELSFNNLPPGHYVFEIYADAGTDESRSETQSFAFTIKPAFWQTTWFLLACVASLLLAGAGVALKIQQRKNRALWEKLRAEKELNELRISSIRLKAIPHFNANILAAIEYYISNRTREEVIRILDIYSDFTYQTLSEVDKAARPLSEELEYVRMYLDLEKIRFLEKFDFQIKVDEGVNEDVQLPNMILHTYCENAVKHGLMPLESGGKLTIQVSQYGNIVCVSVEDNGVGRAYAAQNPHLHSSKQGLSILNRQIEIYNRFNPQKINQRIDDLEAGTRFTVEVPLDFAYIN